MKHLLEFTLIAAGLLAVAGLVHGGSEGEHDDDDERHMARSAVPWHAEYRSECGSCHMAYPPSLLPAASWEAIMSGLDDHFGDNAELAPGPAEKIRAYLVGNSAQRGDRFQRGLGDKAPLRITDTPYFRRKHDEVPARLVTGNDKVGSFSNCQACHRRAEAGSFDEHSVNIPGYGRWDD